MPAPALGLMPLLPLGVGQPCSVKLATEDELAGKVWFRSENQMGLLVPSWGDGRLTVTRSPEGRPAGQVILTTYGMDEGAFAELRERWV
ncbi:MAG TPA: hypothetical protein VGP44_03775 [Gemmatimonadales bacterium]|nr:hypothetical protein [Gemmatimonadales bacterium]